VVDAALDPIERYRRGQRPQMGISGRSIQRKGKADGSDD
jgi:hypothetical protein